MKEKQTFGIQLVGRINREKEKNLTLFARITVNSAVSEISLKQNIASQDWNPISGTGKGRKTEIKELNRFLDQVRTRLNNIYRELLVDGDLPSPSIIKNHFLGIEEQGKSILDAFDYHKKVAVGDLSYNTLKHYKTTLSFYRNFPLSPNWQIMQDELLLMRKTSPFLTLENIGEKAERRFCSCMQEIGE